MSDHCKNHIRMVATCGDCHRAMNEEAGSSFAAPPCWTAPSDIPPDVAKKILAARDALIVNHTDEAFHQLYSIADPKFESYEPWEILEKQSNDQAQGRPEQKGKQL